ncbi:MAG: DUF1273 domain-containing protein [Ruminococcaceae bacterium]|nr:DUF1273 domain-containing protein [Oscillospiraceae bacterium]
MYKVSFTGYRPTKLPFFGEDDPLCIELKERISAQIASLADSGARDFFSGMALGVDTWCAEAVLELKKTRPEIRLFAVIPCKGQEIKWTAEQQKRYNDILAQCSAVKCISSTYTWDCMYRRNRELVSLCDVLLAVYDGKSGGTQYTVDYAKKQGKKVIVLPPV